MVADLDAVLVSVGFETADGNYIVVNEGEAVKLDLVLIQGFGFDVLCEEAGDVGPNEGFGLVENDLVVHVTILELCPPLLGKVSVGYVFELSGAKAQHERGARENNVPQELFDAGLSFVDIDGFGWFSCSREQFDTVAKAREMRCQELEFGGLTLERDL